MAQVKRGSQIHWSKSLPAGLRRSPRKKPSWCYAFAMLYFNVVGTIADVDSTTRDSPLHPAPVLLIETDEAIERVVLSQRAWSGPAHMLQIGRRVHVAAELDFFPRPGSLPQAFHFAFVDLN